MEEEIFGPILPILTFKSFDEAMKRMAADPASARRVYLQPRSEDYRPFHRRTLLRRWRGEPCERPFVC